MCVIETPPFWTAKLLKGWCDQPSKTLVNICQRSTSGEAERRQGRQLRTLVTQTTAYFHNCAQANATIWELTQSISGVATFHKQSGLWMGTLIMHVSIYLHCVNTHSHPSPPPLMRTWNVLSCHSLQPHTHQRRTFMNIICIAYIRCTCILQ